MTAGPKASCDSCFTGGGLGIEVTWRSAVPRLADAAAKGTMAIMLSVAPSRGTLFGLAIGDALGAAIEFEPPGSFPR